MSVPFEVATAVDRCINYVHGTCFLVFFVVTEYFVTTWELDLRKL
jgi:hypothetical protein